MWSKALKNVIADNFTIDDIENIREFVIYQISRTKAMLFHNREMATTMMKSMFKQEFEDIADEEVVNELIENKIQNEITPEFGLSIVKKTISTISDLKMKVITNETEINFITSDVPIIIINPLGIHSAGLSSIGEVIFFPISPQKMIFSMMQNYLVNCQIEYVMKALLQYLINISILVQMNDYWLKRLKILIISLIVRY